MSKEDSNGEGKSQDASMPDTPTKDTNADIYENRGSKKIIRVVTVMAYLFSVSFVGILLSAYYIFLWEPPNPRLMQRQRLRTDPQMQFLITPLSDETDPAKKDSSVHLQSAVNRVHKPLLGRMTQDMFDDSVVHSRDKINPEKLNLILKLRNSLVNAQRAQNRNMSQEIAISSGFNNSLGGVEKGLNPTIDRAKNTISRHGESRENISEKNDNADLPPKFAGFTSTTLDVEGTSSTSKFTTIPGTETSQIHFNKDSVTSVNPIVEEKNHKKKHDAVKVYLVRGFSNATTNNDVTNGNNQRVFKDNNSFKMIQEFLKTDKKESKANHRLINNDREKDPGDVQTSVILEERVNGSVGNSQKNYSNDKSLSKDQIGQITRDTVSTDSSSNNLGFIGDPGFHQTPDEPTIIKSQPRIMETRNSEGERICANLPAFSCAVG